MPELSPSAVRLRAAVPGQRWTVRVRLPDGAATDRLGWVEEVGSDAVTLVGPLDPATGAAAARWTVSYPTVLLVRRAPAARRRTRPAARLRRRARNGSRRRPGRRR